MATTVGGINIDIGVKSDGISAGMDKAKTAVKSGVDSIQSAAKAVQGYLAAVGVGAFSSYIKGAIDAAGALADLSQKTGISAETLSGLEYAAKMSGTSLDGIANGMKKLAVNMYDTSNGTGDAKEAFKTLGIAVTDASGKLKTTDGVMLEVADRFKEMEDGPTKAALAMKIFGKSGEELIPLLNEGAGGIEAMRQRAEELGLTVSDQTASAMEALGDKFDTLGMASMGAARQLAADLTPALTSVADLFLDSTKKGGFLTGALGLLGDSIRGLISIGYGAAAVFEQIGLSIGGLLAASAAALTGNFSGAREILRQNEADVAASSDRWASKIKEVWAVQVEATGAVKAHTAATKDHTEATKKQIAEAEKQAKQIATVTGKLKDELDMLKMNSVQAEIYKQLKAAGVTANSAAGQEIIRLVNTLDQEKNSLKAAAEAAKENTKEVDALFDAQEKLRLANEGQIKTARTMLDLIQFETRLLGMNAGQRAIATLERDLETKGIVKGTQAYEAYIKQLQDATALKGVTEAQIKVAEDTNKAWVDTAKDIEKALTDSLMRGFESGKSMWDSARDYISNNAKSWVVKVGVQPIMGAIGGLMGMGSALAGTGGDSGGSGGGGMSALSGASMLSGMSGAFGAGASWLTGAAGGGSLMGSLSAGASLMGTGTMAGMASGGAMLAGALAPVVLGLGVLSKAMDYSVESRGGGIAASLGANGLSGGHVATFNEFKQTGGLFGGGTTINRDWSSASQGTSDFLIASVTAQTTVNKAYAEILGLNKTALEAYTKSIEINTTGLDEAGVKAAINAEAVKFGAEQASAAFGGLLATFAHAGETASQTLQRLAELSIAGRALNEFGGVFSKVASAGFGATEAMISLAGGLDKLIAKSADFVKSYYSTEEQTGIAARGVLEAMKAAGIADPSTVLTKADFRALVESIDVTTAGGQKQLNALLDIAPQFASLAATMTDQKTTLGDLATLAPAIASLNPMLGASEDAAKNAADVTQSAIKSTQTAIESGTSSVVAAVNSMAASVAAAVANGIAAANSTSAAVANSLSSIESNTRLQGAG